MPEQQSEIRAMADRLDIARLGRVVLLGVKATHKTQVLDTENKYGPEWYPVADDIRGALVPEVGELVGGDELRVAQVFLDEDQITDIDGYAIPFIKKLLRRSESWLNGVQFDKLPWHEVDYSRLFGAIRDHTPQARILLQCYGEMMDTLTPFQIMEKLARHEGLVDYILFDASHGTGRAMDTPALRRYVSMAYEEGGNIGIGVAGGLSAENIEDLLGPLLETFRDISCDAEGQLHYPQGSPTRALDMRKVEQYLMEWSRVTGNKL